jgi:hypothetical protein
MVVILRNAAAQTRTVFVARIRLDFWKCVRPFKGTAACRSSRDFNSANGTNDELLVRNSADGHFYEWWVSNNQLAGADLGNALDIL